MKNKGSMDKEKLIKKREQTLSRALSDSDIFELDHSVDVENFRHDTAEQKFRVAMEAVGIEVIGKYVDNEVLIELHCSTCEKQWFQKPSVAKKDGCPRCKDAKKKIDKDVEFWSRSAKIIADKQGKIVKLSDFDPQRKPSIRDEFVVKCHKGHLFTASHYSLRRDIWCPICETLPDSERVFSSVLSSTAVYGKRMDRHQRKRYITSVAKAKGVQIINVKTEDSKYLVECLGCKARQKLTERQILRNYYLCPNRCTRGGRFNLRQTETFL